MAPSLLLMFCELLVLVEVSLDKWLSIRLRTKWLWARIPLFSLKENPDRKKEIKSSQRLLYVTNYSLKKGLCLTVF